MTIAVPHLSLWAVPVVLAIVGPGPVMAMRILGRVWPKNHPRRQELIAEVKALPYRDRVFYVAEMLETAITDGLPQRLVEQRRRLARLISACRAFVVTFKAGLQARRTPPPQVPSPVAPDPVSLAAAIFLTLILVVMVAVGELEGATAAKAIQALTTPGDARHRRTGWTPV